MCVSLTIHAANRSGKVYYEHGNERVKLLKKIRVDLDNSILNDRLPRLNWGQFLVASF